MQPKTIDASAGLLRQFLEWVAAQPRSYNETMDAWRTSCPRISVWEDALLDGLIAAEDRPAGCQGEVGIILTPSGLAHLAGSSPAGWRTGVGSNSTGPLADQAVP